MKKNHPLRRFAHSRPRLLAAILLGIAVGLALPASWLPLTRALAGWNAAVWFYLTAMGWLMAHASHDEVRIVAEQQDKSAPVVLAIMSIAAVSSLSAIVFELAVVKEMTLHLRLMHYLFTGATVLGSWLLVGMLFTVHYAHMFYRAPGDPQPLAFPDGELHPDYWDFLYFSFTISVAAQTADVTVMTRGMRKVVLAHAVLSFLFNAAILGLSINIAAGLVGT